MDDEIREQLIAHGAIDPTAPNAAERVELIEYLLELGATVEQLIHMAPIPGGLSGLAAIAALPKPTVTLRELAARLQIDIEDLVERWIALGLPVADPDEVTVSAEEADQLVALLVTMGTTSTMLSRAAQLRLLRASGQAVMRLADAIVQSYLAEVEPEDGTELDRARISAMGMAVIRSNINSIETLLVRQMSHAAIRLRSGGHVAADQWHLAIGFVDLVGYTGLSDSMGVDELRELLMDFESTVTRSIVDDDTWVVKMIGDAVMFAAVHPDDALRAAIRLLDALRVTHPDLEVAGGIASGTVLAIGGDYFGPVVNLAARAAAEALGGETLITDDVATATSAEALPAGWAIEPAGRRRLRGIPDPVPLWSLRRA